MIVIVTAIHAKWYSENKPIAWWWHPVWVIPFVAVIAYYYLHYHNLVQCLIMSEERLIFYNVILNLFRKEPFFYLDGESTNGSWWDKELEKLNGLWAYIWAFLTLVFIFAQFKP